MPLIKHALEDADDRRPEDRVLAASCPGIEWLSEPRWPTSSASSSPAAAATTGEPPAPGLHGTGLESVAVGDTTLQPDAPNRIPYAPTPRSSSSFTNQGENDEFDVKVTVTIEGGAKPIKVSAHGRHRSRRAQTADGDARARPAAADRRRR